MKLILEPRYLFDGSVVAAVKHAQDGSHRADNHAEHHNDHHATPASLSHDAPPAAATHALTGHDRDHAVPQNPNATEILIVDPRVANWQTLAASVGSNVQVIVIDPNRDGLAQVTRARRPHGHHCAGIPDLRVVRPDRARPDECHRGFACCSCR